MTSRLRVTLSQDIDSPATGLELLLAFHFGNLPTREHPAIVNVDLDPIGRDDLYECWWIDDHVEFRAIGNVRIAECTDYAVAVLECDERDDDDHQRLTCEAYRELLLAIEQTRHRQLVKVWNYLGGINDGEGDDERYRQFSVGRAMAFVQTGIADESAPTGTGVGTQRDRGLTIIALASDREFALAENPRQVSAFHYPPQYGPKSPKFGRGGSVATDSHRLHLISGTASIVGHESMHPGDTDLQVDETLRNLDALCESVSTLDDSSPALSLDDHCVLRVYLREPADYSAVAGKLERQLGLGRDHIAYLHGNICRRELMVEIDGVRVQ